MNVKINNEPAIVSDGMKLASIATMLQLPDKGVAVKNISTVVDTYEYTYNEVGTYTATFLLNNGNYHHGDSKVCNIIIDVK